MSKQITGVFDRGGLGVDIERPKCQSWLMCGRYVLKHSLPDLQGFFGFVETELALSPRFNIAPSQAIPILWQIDGSKTFAAARWGLIPFWAEPGQKLPAMINARSETIATKPAFRKSFANRRCIIPASGYYEWKLSTSGKKQPFFMSRTDGLPLPFAGIWDISKSADGGQVVSAAIVTTAADPANSHHHYRMPVILRKEDWGSWLNEEPLEPEFSASLFSAGLPFPLELRQVSPAVNRVSEQGEQLLEPAVEEPDLFG